jgi:16S rRNA (cytosine967-C5)-methyltransferase
LAPLSDALAASAAVVAQVAAGRSLATQLEQARRKLDPAARGAITDLCHGTLRRYGRLPAIVAALSRNPGASDPLVEALLWCALYALESGRYAEYTVVDQAARACNLTERQRARPFVNGLLRSYLRGRDGLEARLAQNVEARHCHPGWWIERLRTAHPGQWEQVLAAGNAHPPMCLRVNVQRTSVDAYAALLAQAGITARPVGTQALLLAQPMPSEKLPGFADGLVSVQDAGAQRAAPLLDLRSGQRVLDACAAPGGKSAHLLELASVELDALDVDPERLADVARNLARLGFSQPAHAVRLSAADSTQPAAWWDAKPYDRILADVPCSASGIARRHPDIKWLRRESDLAGFAARQARILDSLWRLLGSGGKLLYVTCSVFQEENGAVVDAFVARTPKARLVPIEGRATLQLLPGPEHDGFFFALLEKPV